MDDHRLWLTARQFLRAHVKLSAHPGNCRGAITNLLANIITYLQLAAMLFLTVAVAENPTTECSGRSEDSLAVSQAAAISQSVVVRFYAAHDDVPPQVAASVDKYNASASARETPGWRGRREVASTAMRVLPCVPFLKPGRTTQAISPMIWLSVVRAPIAPQLIESAINWPVTISKALWRSGAVRSPAIASDAPVPAAIDAVTSIASRIGNQAFPCPTTVRGFKIGAHDDFRRA